MDNMKWVDSKAKYNRGELLMLGGWVVGKVYWDCMKSAADKSKYTAICLLPGVNTSLWHYETGQQAKDRVKLAVHRWIADAGLRTA